MHIGILPAYSHSSEEQSGGARIEFHGENIASGIEKLFGYEPLVTLSYSSFLG